MLQLTWSVFFGGGKQNVEILIHFPSNAVLKWWLVARVSPCSCLWRGGPGPLRGYSYPVKDFCTTPGASKLVIRLSSIADRSVSVVALRFYCYNSHPTAFSYLSDVCKWMEGPPCRFWRGQGSVNMDETKEVVLAFSPRAICWKLHTVLPDKLAHLVLVPFHLIKPKWRSCFLG